MEEKPDIPVKERLIECARDEFSEKGYMKASVRSICNRAGVTTGALYFFFKDKADLFSAVVGEAYKMIMTLAKKHFDDEREYSERGELVDDNNNLDFEMEKQIVNVLYAYRTEILLLLTKSQGSTYENIKDEFVDLFDSHHTYLSDSQCKILGIPKRDHALLHWVSHVQADVFIYMITHIEDEKKGEMFLDGAMKYLIAGWKGIHSENL